MSEPDSSDITHVIGRHAEAYFSPGPEAVGDWGESVLAITGVDERKSPTG